MTVPCAPRAAMLVRNARSAEGARSTKVALPAPRESDSSPSAPDPAYRSSTRSPSNAPRIEKSASRTRSAVGRVSRPAGATSRRPPHWPAMILIHSGWQGFELLRAIPRAQGVGEQDVLGRLELGILREHGGRDGAGALEQVLVVGHPRDAKLPEAGLPRTRQLALLAQLEVDLGEREAVGVLLERLQPRRARGAEEDAHARVAAASDAPAELVQLRDAVALGVLDEHHRRVGHVDADLDDAGGHEDVGAAGGEGGHGLLLVARAHLPVHEHTAEVLELGRLQALVLARRGARLELLGLLDERADDERLAPRAQLLAHALVGPRAPGLR